MKCFSHLLGGIAAVTLAGCAGGHVAEGLNGRYGRTFMADDHDGNQAQVIEVWQFNGTTAGSLHATWTGYAHGVPYKTMVDQGWSMKYRGQGRFELEEKGRRVEGPPMAELEDSYEMELDGNEVQVDGGPSDAPLHRLLESVAPARTSAASAPIESAAKHSTTTTKTKKKH